VLRVFRDGPGKVHKVKCLLHYFERIRRKTGASRSSAVRAGRACAHAGATWRRPVGADHVRAGGADHAAAVGASGQCAPQYGHMHTFTHTHAHTHTHIYIYIHTYTHTHTYIHTHTHTYIHTHIHTYTHTYIHTNSYIHTYIHTTCHSAWAECDVFSAAAQTVRVDGLIEDDGVGMRQMDFANQYLGGGVLGEVSTHKHGNVQAYTNKHIHAHDNHLHHHHYQQCR
jgi:hypothetical protein